jgi:hypothetical protein
MFLSMYSDYINTVDPQMIIIISFIFWLYSMFFLMDVFVFYMFDSLY